MIGAKLGLLLDGPEDGPRAMARDEVLLEVVAERGGECAAADAATPPRQEHPADGSAATDAGNAARAPAVEAAPSPDGAPTDLLRLHGWLRPTLTIGRTQPIPEELVAEATAVGVDLVRRPTGGGWLLHLPGDIAFTYAVGGPLGPGDLRLAARRAALAIAGGLARCGRAATVFMGLPGTLGRADVCFQRADRDEVVLGETKVAGVALARFGRRALVQTAIPTVPAFGDLARFAARWDERREAAAEASCGVEREALWDAVAEGLALLLDVRAETWQWPAARLRDAERRREERLGRPGAVR